MRSLALILFALLPTFSLGQKTQPLHSLPECRKTLAWYWDSSRSLVNYERIYALSMDALSDLEVELNSCVDAHSRLLSKQELQHAYWENELRILAQESLVAKKKLADAEEYAAAQDAARRKEKDLVDKYNALVDQFNSLRAAYFAQAQSAQQLTSELNTATQNAAILEAISRLQNETNRTLSQYSQRPQPTAIHCTTTNYANQLQTDCY